MLVRRRGSKWGRFAVLALVLSVPSPIILAEQTDRDSEIAAVAVRRFRDASGRGKAIRRKA